jgi:hypothetical protein
MAPGFTSWVQVLFRRQWAHPEELLPGAPPHPLRVVDEPELGRLIAGLRHVEETMLRGATVPEARHRASDESPSRVRTYQEAVRLREALAYSNGYLWDPGIANQARALLARQPRAALPTDDRTFKAQGQHGPPRPVRAPSGKSQRAGLRPSRQPNRAARPVSTRKPRGLVRASRPRFSSTNAASGR